MLRHLLLATTALIAVTPAAHAQTAPDANTSGTATSLDATTATPSTQSSSTATQSQLDSGSGDDITVTATRRATSLQRTPVTISALSGDDLEKLGTTEQPVSFYFDDIFQARPSVVNQEFADVERVEVLRGPQGTLFGRNSTVGAVNVISRTPGDTAYGTAAVSYGIMMCSAPGRVRCAAHRPARRHLRPSGRRLYGQYHHRQIHRSAEFLGPARQDPL
jgi:iron complex outermembrane receptor protein